MGGRRTGLNGGHTEKAPWRAVLGELVDPVALAPGSGKAASHFEFALSGIYWSLEQIPWFLQASAYPLAIK